MAAEAPANDLLKLMKLVERYDFEKLLDAATVCDWTVISGDEKKEIESQNSKQNRLDRLMTLIAEPGRAARFANFILRYNSSIQAAALAVVNRPTVDAATCSSQMRPETQQPADCCRKSSSTANTGSPMDLDTTESPGACSMDTDSKESFCTQYDNLSNSSQESSDFGYYSGSSKDFLSQNHPGGGYLFFQSPQQNLKVIQKNQRSRQRELKRLDITKHQHNTTVVNHYHFSPKRDLEQLVTPHWLRPIMNHCPNIIQTLNMQMLTPRLLQNGLLAFSECQELDALRTPWKKAEYFVLNVLPSKGERGFKLFLKSLKEETEHFGHQDLFRHLESSAK